MTVGIIIVGGVPKPIGGITTFVRRLAATDDRIEEIIDLYPNQEKEVPQNFKGRHKQCRSKLGGYIYMFCKMMTWSNKYIHFNFSKFKAIFFCLFLPKFRSKWILMLHHGELDAHFPAFLTEHLLRRFDYIFCMNEQQRNIYSLYIDQSEIIISTNSYVKPINACPDKSFQEEIDEFFESKPTFIASGYPSLIYNFDWCVRFVNEREDYQLALFLYGEGTEKLRMKTQFSKNLKIRVFWDQTENDFNYALSKSHLYLRPNTRDSFGIAVADAINLGIPVLASDVCTRFKGAKIFTITTYESFEETLVHLLENINTKCKIETAPFIPFSYDLITDISHFE